MKKLRKLSKSISVVLSALVLFASCTSTTMIHSIPPNAKLYIDGEYKGETSYKHKDTKIVFSTTDVKLTKEGYEDYHASFSKDEEVDIGAIVVGFLFLYPIWLWALKYDPSRTYELEPINPQQSSNSVTQTIKINHTVNSKADSLRELKKLLDEGILTQEEYEKEKKKILEQD